MFRREVHRKYGISNFQRTITRFLILPATAKIHPVSIESPTKSDIDSLAEFFRQHDNIVCITGAGVSTLSGIPDYRGPNGSYKRGHKPITHSEFMSGENTRKRYWTRSMIGWQTVSKAQPNSAHIALANLESRIVIQQIVTQNVDQLHQKSGSKKVIDIHGRIDQVKCQRCGDVTHRDEFQRTLLDLNREALQNIKAETLTSVAGELEVRADGDAEVKLQDYSHICVPNCTRCGGILKPNVVFFGDNVPLAVVEDIYEKVDNCSAILTVGTSLEVFSAYRFLKRANSRNIPIAIINHGETRAEREQLHSVCYKSDTNCGELLSAAVKQM